MRDVERVDPRVTGHPIQTYYASGQMQRTYLHAAAYAFLAVLIVLMLDFQSLSLSLLALPPLAAGVLVAAGVLGWLDIPFNAANMIVLPLVLGIGIDNGVHVVHDWRSQPRGRYRLTAVGRGRDAALFVDDDGGVLQHDFRETPGVADVGTGAHPGHRLLSRDLVGFPARAARRLGSFS